MAVSTKTLVILRVVRRYPVWVDHSDELFKTENDKPSQGVLMLGCKEEYHRKDCISICYGDDKYKNGTVDETPIPLASGRATRRLE